MASPDVEGARGTAWRIWDLHVHTPASIVQGYGGNTDEVLSRFIDELENLPEYISVIGVNDYWFLNGYKRILHARRSGRLQNLEAIFPVVEMRLDQFGGTEGKLSRVNLHVVFDPELEPDVIQAQFLNALQPKLKLSPGHETLGWQGVITEESLTDLGRRIKESVPTHELGKYDSDLREGFNNLNVSLVDVQTVLAGPYFKGKALVGVGKTEWADIKWSDQSIAAKKNVINSAHLIFTAFEDTARWKTDVEFLRASKVNDRLLDCSDAHHFSDSDQPTRLGACQTWMNTTPTLAGLAYALEEFDRRVYVGLEPPALARIRKNPERFISRIEVKSEKEGHTLFGYEIPLNSGFVAVVGNKGQGKSALLDCIALAGNSSRNREFAFLTPTRFLSSTSMKVAREYYTELQWATGSTRRAQLPDEHDRSAPVSVEYLPQAFVERVCNIDPATGDADEFERELRTVLFTHIREEDRSGEKTFDALLTQKTRVSQDTIDRLRDDLRAVVGSYMAIATFRAQNRLSEVDGRLTLKEAEVSAAEAALQTEKNTLADIDAASRDDGELAALKQRSEEIESARTELLSRRTENEQRQAQARQSLSEMETIVQRAEALRADGADLSARARARQRVLESEERVAALVGDENDGESLNGLKALRTRITEAPDRMDQVRDEIIEHAGRIHAALRAQLDAVDSLYAPASDFIARSEVVKSAGLEFNAELRMLPTWRSVPTGLDGRRNGDFSDWLAQLPQRIEDTSWEQLSTQLKEALVRLEHERGEPEDPVRDPANALRSTT